VVETESSASSSRNRLLAAGKHLFGQSGYEQTSTAAIARAAGTSESQLVRYFGGKSGLLDAIFNEAWAALNEDIDRHVGQAVHGREAVLRVLTAVMQALGRDHDIAFLFLFEGRRVRGNVLALSKGFLQFYETIRQLVARGQKDGSFRADLSVEVLVSALVGCAEGMMRDRMIRKRAGLPGDFDDTQIERAFESVVNGLAAGS
jgi:AcrR family transcriptional regulator